MSKSPEQLPLPLHNGRLDEHLIFLRLSHIAGNYQAIAKDAAAKGWSHIQYLATLIGR